MKRNKTYTKKTMIKVEEYKRWYKENKRLPNSSDRFADGIKMDTWRHNYLELLREFENSVGPEISAYKKSIECQETYLEMIPYEFHGYPNTFQDYMEGDNRYKYFNLMTYINIMSYMGNDDNGLVPYINFIHSLYFFTKRANEDGWNEFHRFFNIKTLICQIEYVLDNHLEARYSMIIRYRYGLKGYKKSPLAEIAKELCVSRERIRSLEAKAMRLLKHPMRLRLMRRANSLFEDHINWNSYGHWFEVHLVTDKRSIETKVINRPNYALNEALEELGYIDSFGEVEYQIESVKTKNLPPWEIDNSTFKTMNIPVDILMKNIDYPITFVTVRKISYPKVEERLEEYLQRTKDPEDELTITEIECIKLSPSEYRKRRNLMSKYKTFFIFRFAAVIDAIFDNLYLDSEYAWINTFNDMISSYMIPDNKCADAAEVISAKLNIRLRDFSIVCEFYRHHLIFNTMKLSLNERK